MPTLEELISPYPNATPDGESIPFDIHNPLVSMYVQSTGAGVPRILLPSTNPLSEGIEVAIVHFRNVGTATLHVSMAATPPIVFPANGIVQDNSFFVGGSQSFAIVVYDMVDKSFSFVSTSNANIGVSVFKPFIALATPEQFQRP